MHTIFDPLFLSIAVRTLIVGIVLVAGLRLLGKRQLGQMNIYDLAAILLIANAVQNAMTEGSGKLGVGFASAGALLCFGAVLTSIFLRLPKLEEQIAGVPTILIQDGHLLPDALRRESITQEQVEQALREHEICEISDVGLAVLEPDGTVSVIPKDVPSGIPRDEAGS